MTTDQTKYDARLRATLNSLDFLGFDRFGQAYQAIAQHDDWAERWDVEYGRTEAETELHMLVRDWRRFARYNKN